MPSPVLQPASEPLSIAVLLNPPRKRWTRIECEVLETTGVLGDQRVELIEGELINKMGKNRPHINVATLVSAWLMRVFGPQFVNQEAPIDVAPQDNPTNEPEPDLIVLAKPSREFKTNPLPKDIRLAVEISDSTLGFDLTKKAALYARAGIVEYWVFDISESRLIVHRNPVNGKYQSIAAYSRDESIAPLAAPEASLVVGEIFEL